MNEARSQCPTQALLQSLWPGETVEPAEGQSDPREQVDGTVIQVVGEKCRGKLFREYLTDVVVDLYTNPLWPNQ